MVGTAYLTSKYVFDIKNSDIYWCTADVGWVTGHSYMVYGILSNGARPASCTEERPPISLISPRFWSMIERYKVTVFYTAPTRHPRASCARMGREFVDKATISRHCAPLLGSVGEPINPEAWMWYYDVVGHNKCPIVDTWWQTETGMIMITPLPGVTPLKPGTATLPFFGVDAAIVDREGKELGPNQGGLLVVRKPWPSMLRGIFNDPDRYAKQYWSDVPGMYFTGDGARRDNDGYFWIMGRIDDVINVSGHRLGTAEVESAIVSHPSVAEGRLRAGIMPHELKGQGLAAAFVTLRTGTETQRRPEKRTKQHRRQTNRLLRPP